MQLSKRKKKIKVSKLSGSNLSETPYKGLFGSNGESQESFSAESLSPAAEMCVIRIDLIDRGNS